MSPTPQASLLLTVPTPQTQASTSASVVLEPRNKPLLLELFCGTKSVSMAMREQYDCISMDMSPSCEPDICLDILKLDYLKFQPGAFNVVWASPPCNEYSIAKNGRPRNLEYADSLVKYTLRIIKYLKPHYWFIENPATGLLPHRPFMRGFRYYDVSYCKYGTMFLKRTRIWTNSTSFHPLMCSVRTPCATSTYNEKGRLCHISPLATFSRRDRGRIPQILVKQLLDVEQFPSKNMAPPPFTKRELLRCINGTNDVNMAGSQPTQTTHLCHQAKRSRSPSLEDLVPAKAQCLIPSGRLGKRPRPSPSITMSQASYNGKRQCMAA